MTWRRKGPGHQQPWYWHVYPGIFLFQLHKDYTYWGSSKWPPFCRRRFKLQFLVWKLLNFDPNSIEVFSLILQLTHGLALVQILKSHYLKTKNVWRQMTSPGHNKLSSLHGLFSLVRNHGRTIVVSKYLNECSHKAMGFQIVLGCIKADDWLHELTIPMA